MHAHVGRPCGFRLSGFSSDQSVQVRLLPLPEQHSIWYSAPSARAMDGHHERCDDSRLPRYSSSQPSGNGAPRSVCAPHMMLSPMHSMSRLAGGGLGCSAAAFRPRNSTTPPMSSRASVIFSIRTCVSRAYRDRTFAVRTLERESELPSRSLPRRAAGTPRPGRSC